MSTENPTDVPTTTDTRAAVREKAQQVQARQARMRWLRRVLLTLLALVALGAIVYGVYLALDSGAEEEVRHPVGLTDDGMAVTTVTPTATEVDPELVEATPDPAASDEAEDQDERAESTINSDAVDIHIYVDYLAPGAGDFERANARQLSTWIASGAVAVTYHPVALLTANTNGTKYSLRAAGAAACVATHSPTQFYAFNHELLVTQPEAGSDGPSDSDLADLAIAVGSDNAKLVRACIEEKHFVSWAKDATARALEGPLPGTDGLVLTAAPTIIVNGKAYIGRMDDPAEFSQFVLTVHSQDYSEEQENGSGDEKQDAEDETDSDEG